MRATCDACDAMQCNAMQCVLATLTSSHTVSLLLFSVRTTDSPNWTESFVLFFLYDSVPACVVLKKEKSVFCQHEPIAVVDFAEDGLAS